MSTLQPDQLKAVAERFRDARLSASDYQRAAQAIARCGCSSADMISAVKGMNKSGVSLGE